MSMSVHQIADRLVELCRTGQHLTAYRELFAPDASSHEMPGIPNNSLRGLDALIAKAEAWNENVVEVHKLEVSDPLVYGNHFAVGMGVDLTKKDSGRESADEICVYEVRDGKIASERFVYSLG